MSLPIHHHTLPQTTGTGASDGWCPLGSLGVIRAQGPEAVKFLQGQLTQDFSLLPPGQARLAAYCSAKGRMQASFIGIKRSEEEVLLLCSADLLAQTLRRLSMFVLRAQLRLTDDSAAWLLRGLAGSAVPAGLAAAPWSALDTPEGMAIRLYPAEGVSRALLLSPVGATDPGPGLLEQAVWDWLEVRSGVAMVTRPVFEAFVPQMLNYESVGGVSFKKGCYPGQEVVARSQFRGTLKRRAFVVHGESPVLVGQEVFHSQDNTQPCGTVAAAAARPDGGGFDAIVSMQTSAASGGSLHLGTADGPALRVLPLPYVLLDDI
ncbi:MAG TPA: folate-binding protein [Hydrogenophaga sp.]|uniref:CAF17-like 4Fe-4S cluster assembly/insertion protein YgfZ n=1 Tax=Hydrogenophaga sp. TaxID=1904254 RepID=UPI002B5581C3|nr:folate-binding protein [Hydrogenophaga sp.]HMN92918.1 folate-binding protein [Hydrogenophaga sp.]HMP09779.1 folate-binding protein [Hydrogenophaga sp.]